MRVGLICGVIAVFCIALFEGCLFDPRQPEPPSTGSEVPWRIPVEPWYVLTNLKATTEARVVTNFDRSLTSDYKFRFDFGDAQTDTVWTKDRDIAAITALFQGKGPTTLTWTPADSGGGSADRFYRNLRYRLVMRRSATDTSRVTIAGKCNLYMRQESGSWILYRWEDLQEGTLPTWGWARLNPNLPRPAGP